MTTDTVDFNGVLQANLTGVFSERDAAKRHAAIREIYAPDAILYEPDEVSIGHDEIAHTVDALLKSMPPNFVFTALGPAAGHHGLGRLRWSAGPPEGPVAVTGLDVVRIESGRIQSLHVFLDAPAA